MTPNPPYIPTPEQIAADCKVIQDEWTPTQERNRTVTKPKPFAFQTIPIRSAVEKPTWLPEF